MAKCKECGKESDDYKLCTDCKKDWKRKRLKAYEIVESEIGKQTYQNRKEFKNRLNQVEKLTTPVVLESCPYCGSEVNYLNHKKHLYMNCIDSCFDSRELK